MKRLLAILMCLVGLAGSIPVAVALWGLWSLSTVSLTGAIICLGLGLLRILIVDLRQRHRLARFGEALRYEHLPTYHQPLRVPRAGRRLRRGRLGMG